MKVGPLIRVLEADPDFEVVLVHTGQHYDNAMSGTFFHELGIRRPDHNLDVGGGSHAQQTAEIMRGFEPVVLNEKPDVVIVVGDVNSTMACALVAKKLGVAVVHVEAGLRSFDRSMPEEINRLVTDAISDLLLVTEESGRRNLRREGVPEDRIFLVGNLMIDSLRKHLERARESAILDRLEIREKPYGVVTLHRPGNVDSLDRLGELLGVLTELSREVPLLFPVHPRTRAHLERMQFAIDGRITFLEPLGYLDFLCMMAHSRIVLTDSGGIQEETTALGVPCLTLRDNTERPVTVEQGTNVIAGTSTASILTAWASVKRNPPKGALPSLWDGNTAERCRQVLRQVFCGDGQQR